ncbi:MAG: archaellar assembly protein FlaJ [Euryarchaeota archaeon]|nr:archaellar assembly protein FlaJ [Euryarchaeota archaeon]
MMKYRLALSTMEMDRKKYLTLLGLTIGIFGIAFPALTWFSIGPYMEVTSLFAVFASFYFLVMVVVIWPYVSASQRRIKIDRTMPSYITELAALATSDMGFERIFHILSQKKEYGPLSKDSEKIYRLMKLYNVSVSVGCAFVASQSPSKLENDFFSRLSHAIDVGEPLDRFMNNEHDVLMDEYVLRCESSLKDVDFLKEIYTGAVTALIFICVFVAIIPLLSQTMVDELMIGVVVGFVIMEALFVVLILSKVPKEDIWYPFRQKIKGRLVSDKDRILILSLFVAIAGIFLLFITLKDFDLPPMLMAASIFMPVLIPGILMMREEKRIEKRDEIFGAFIRSLGRSSSVSGQTMPGAVKNLAVHKFGPLTSMVENLSKRLNMYIDPRKSWEHFAAESSSNLIKRFSSIYMECVLSGSKPEETSSFISNNLFKVLTIRKKRLSISSGFYGVFYGIMVSLAFTLWITIGIIEYMNNVVTNLNVDTSGIPTGGFLDSIFNASYNVDLLNIMVFSIIIIHAFFSAIMIPIVKGGSIATTGVHFVLLIWVGAVSGYIVDLVLNVLMM